MTNLLRDLVNLFYPNHCLTCGYPLVKNEQFICLYCHCKIPNTNYHINKSNSARDLFSGYTQVNEVVSYLFFEKEGITQKLIHSLKYFGNKELAAYLARTAAIELKATGCFASIDAILPIPLHPKKEKKRGYNQSEWIAKGIGSIYGVEIERKFLRRITDTQSQTRKSIYDRHVNVERIFEVSNPSELFGKHVLLVDDVLTTGATISSCIDALISVPDIKVSIFTLSIAREF